MLDCPTNAAEAIEELRAEGLNLTLDHIALLIELGRRVQNPPHRTQHYLEGVGVRAGARGPRLLPLSIEGGLWFDWASSALSSDDEITFALTFASDPENAGSFNDLYEVTRARDAVKAYSKAMGCNMRELESALIRLMDEQTPGDELRAERHKGEGVDISDSVARMVSATGLPSEYWYGKPVAHGMAVLTHAMQMQTAAMGVQEKGDPEYERACFDFAAAVQKVESECRESMELEKSG